MITAVLICGGLLLAWLGAYLWLTRASRTAPYQGRHVPFADPADRTDPYGDKWLERLRPERLPECGLLEPVTDDADWWAQSAPAGRVEVLERVREGLLAVPPDGTSATFQPAPGVTMPVSDDPDTTGVNRHAAAVWGKTAAELAADLASKYLTAEVPR